MTRFTTAALMYCMHFHAYKVFVFFWLHTEKLLWDILIGMCISANMDPLKNEMGHLKGLSTK